MTTKPDNLFFLVHYDTYIIHTTSQHKPMINCPPIDLLQQTDMLLKNKFDDDWLITQKKKKKE